MTITQTTTDIPGPPNNPVSGSSPITIPPVTNAPANFPESPQTSTNDPDQLSHLLEVKIGGIPFPCTHFTENSSQDLAIHKFPNLDSARVENTGRNPSVYTCRGIFTNNIYPSGKESWKQGDLFPRAFELVLNVLYDSSTYQILQHPFLGLRNVMVQSWKYDFIGNGPRDGVYMDMSFIETIGDDNTNKSFSTPDSLADMQNTGLGIDNEISSTALSPMNPPNLSMGQFFSKISGLIRNVVSFPQQTISGINATLIQVNSSIQGAGAAIATSLPQLINTGAAIVNQNKGLILNGPISNAYYYDKAFGQAVFNINQDALNNVYTTSTALNSNAAVSGSQLISNTIAFTRAMIIYYQTLNRIETSNVILQLYQFLRQLQSIQASLFANVRNYKIRSYVVTNPTSLFAVSKLLNNSIDQLLQLNSELNKLYIIPDGTVIKYYQG